MMKMLRIGLAISHSFAYYRGVLRGIARYSEGRPQWLFTFIAGETQPLLTVGRQRLAGLIASVNTRAAIRKYAQCRRPVVNICDVTPGLRFPRVGVDNRSVGQLAADHFLQRGLRHFGFIGPPDHLYSTERQEAFCQALKNAGGTVASYHTPASRPFDPEDRLWDLGPNVSRWLRRLPKPVGIFAPGDNWGVQIAEVCRGIGLRVPDDVALLGVDDDDLDCELARPRLSSVIVPAERIGYEAAALLDQLLAGEKPPADPILLPPLGVMTRRSTETLAIDDREVAAAVRFIREHAHLPLRVNDVLREVPVGRRSLEKRCTKALGRGLGEEIRHAHVELARRLLARTELPVKAVAERAGFSDFRHLAVSFRRSLGLTPSAYRRQMRGEAE